MLTKDTDECLKEEKEWFIDKTDIIKADLLNDELFGQNPFQSVDVQFSLNTQNKLFFVVFFAFWTFRIKKCFVLCKHF